MKKKTCSEWVREFFRSWPKGKRYCINDIHEYIEENGGRRYKSSTISQALGASRSGRGWGASAR